MSLLPALEASLRHYEWLFPGYFALLLGVDEDERAPLQAIRSVRPDIANAIEGYLQAYREWLAFHQGIERAGKVGALDAAEAVRLTELSVKLDETEKHMMKFRSEL